MKADSKKRLAMLLFSAMLCTGAQNGEALFETVKTALEEAGYFWEEVDVYAMPAAGKRRFARGPQGYFDLMEDESGVVQRLAFLVDRGQDSAAFLRALGEEDAQQAAQVLKTRYEESFAYHSAHMNKKDVRATAFSRGGSRYYELEEGWLYATFLKNR